MSLLTGGAYAVSAGLVIFAQLTELTPEDLRFPLIMGWAVVGLVLAVINTFRSKDK